MSLTRRRMMEQSAAFGAALLAAPAAAAAHEAGWRAGSVQHLLPTASHDRILLKASFAAPPRLVPHLLVGDRAFAGEMTDTEGLFWQFDAAGLAPGRPQPAGLARGPGRAAVRPLDPGNPAVPRRPAGAVSRAHVHLRRGPRCAAGPPGSGRQAVPCGRGADPDATARAVLPAGCGHRQRRPRLLGPPDGARRPARRPPGRSRPCRSVRSRPCRCSAPRTSRC